MKTAFIFLFILSFNHFAEASKKNIKSKYFENELQIRKILASTYTYNLQIKKNLIHRTALDSERQVLDLQTKELAEKIQKLNQEQSKIKKDLFKRLKAINELKGEGLFNIFMSAQSANDLDMYSKVMTHVLKKDRTNWQQFEDNKTKLISNQQAFLSKLSLLNEKREQVAKEELQILDIQNKKAELLAQIKKNQNKLIKRIVASEDSDVLNLSFIEKKGRLESPVVGEIIQKYGLVKNNIDDVVFKNNGVWIRPLDTQKLKIIFPGQVAFSGQIDGFGNTVIVDHGDHFYTTYSGQFESNFTEGEKVQESQLIAETNNNVYFEIRHFSESYDPQKWLKGN